MVVVFEANHTIKTEAMAIGIWFNRPIAWMLSEVVGHNENNATKLAGNAGRNN